MSKPQTKTEFRDGTLGWWLMEAGWEPVETPCPRGGRHVKDQQGKCSKCNEFAHPLWRLDGFEESLTGWQARRLELLRIHNDFKAKARTAA